MPSILPPAYKSLSQVGFLRVNRAGGLKWFRSVVLHDFAQVRYSASVVAVEYLRAVDFRQVARNRLIACASDCSIDACLHVHGVIPSHP